MKKKTRKAWGILNAYGDLWSIELSATETGANEKIRVWEERYQPLPKHKAIPVTISY